MKVITESVKIRLAKVTDISEIYHLSRGVQEVSGTSNCKYSKEIIFYYKDEIAEMIKDRQDNIWLVAEIKKDKITKISGFLFAKIMSSDWCYLDSIGVKKQFRNRGIGTRLYSELIKVCKKRKISYLQALVDVKNKKGQEFWKNKGFKKGKIFCWIDREL
jgi:ribosomal protein S18 acetylase RimI-like enzyme